MAAPTSTTGTISATALHHYRGLNYTLRHITLHLGHMHSPARYITYRNNPDLCPSDEEQTPAAWKTLHPNLEADW